MTSYLVKTTRDEDNKSFKEIRHQLVILKSELDTEDLIGALQNFEPTELGDVVLKQAGFDESYSEVESEEDFLRRSSRENCFPKLVVEKMMINENSHATKIIELYSNEVLFEMSEDEQERIIQEEIQKKERAA